jgi:D-alanyl-D-alanine carboxypeptidase
VRTPQGSFDGAAGRSRFGGPSLEPDALFRAASVTKTFVSAAILVLWERGEISLDAPIEGLLSEGSVGALRGGGYDPAAITVRHLLTHTSGLFDYTDTSSFDEIIDEDATHRWSRAEQLELAMDEGEPLSEPGAEYHYGDTNYILLGEILERQTSLPLGAAMRGLLRYEELGLKDTWMETLEEAPQGTSGRLSHPYLEEEDTFGWDPSWDLFGGGGLVTSTQDLVRFMAALFDTEDGIFRDARTLAEMLKVPPPAEGAFFGADGAAGVGRFELDDGRLCYGGFGFFSTIVVRCEEPGWTFAATLNQSDPKDGEVLLDGVLELLVAQEGSEEEAPKARRPNKRRP